MSAAGTGDVSVAGICQIRDLGVWDAARAYQAAFTAASAAELTGSGSAGYYLRQAALEAVIEEQMRVRCAISIHRALLAGAPAAEIAHVLGTTARTSPAGGSTGRPGSAVFRIACPARASASPSTTGQRPRLRTRTEPAVSRDAHAGHGRANRFTPSLITLTTSER